MSVYKGGSMLLQIGYPQRAHHKANHSLSETALRFEGSWYNKRLKKFRTLQPDLFLDRPVTHVTKRFAVIGDPGSGTKDQWAIAESLTDAFKRKPFGSVLVLGDNVYENGEPHLFKERIYKPYKRLFRKGVRFFPVLGNHDVRQGYGDKQLAFWGAPGYYSFRIGDVAFFAIDTTVFLPGLDGCYRQNPQLARKKAQIQLQWLDKALADSTAGMKVVFGHYPLYSSGVHGALETYYLNLRKQLEPLFVKHGVDLYLSGHDHHYEKTPPIQGVTHIVSGAAGKLFRFLVPFYKHPREKVLSKFHFMLFEIGPDNSLSYEVLGKKGKLLDQGVIRPKQKKLSTVG